MKNLTYVIIFSFITLLGCSNDSNDDISVEQGVEMEDDNSENPSDEDDNPEIELPLLAVLGSNIQTQDGLLLREWSSDYTTNSDTDFSNVFDTNSVNESNVSDLFITEDYFYIAEEGITSNTFIKYDINTAVSTTYSIQDYFNVDQSAVIERISIPSDKFITTYYQKNEGSYPFPTYLYSYNIETLETFESVIYDGVVTFSDARTLGDYSLGLYGDVNSKNLYITNLSTEQTTILSFDAYSRVSYNSEEENIIYLFKEENSNSIKDYDIYNLDSNSVIGEGSLPEPMPKATSFFFETTFYQNSFEFFSGGFTAFRLNLDTDEVFRYDAWTINELIIDNTTFDTNQLGSVSIDLENSLIYYTFTFDYGAAQSGAVAFLNFDLEILNIVETDFINARFIIQK